MISVQPHHNRAVNVFLHGFQRLLRIVYSQLAIFHIGIGNDAFFLGFFLFIISQCLCFFLQCIPLHGSLVLITAGQHCQNQHGSYDPTPFFQAVKHKVHQADFFFVSLLILVHICFFLLFLFLLSVLFFT